MVALQPERVEAMVVIARTHRLIGSAARTHEAAVHAGLPSGWYLDEVRKWHPGGESPGAAAFAAGAAAALTEEFPMPEDIYDRSEAPNRSTEIRGNIDRFAHIIQPPQHVGLATRRRAGWVSR